MSQEQDTLDHDAEDGTAVSRREYRSRDPKIGLELLDGRFQVTELIARGGMGRSTGRRAAKRRRTLRSSS